VAQDAAIARPGRNQSQMLSAQCGAQRTKQARNSLEHRAGIHSRSRRVDFCRHRLALAHELHDTSVVAKNRFLARAGVEPVFASGVATLGWTKQTQSTTPACAAHDVDLATAEFAFATQTKSAVIQRSPSSLPVKRAQNQ